MYNEASFLWWKEMLGLRSKWVPPCLKVRSPTLLALMPVGRSSFFFWCCFILLFVHSKPQSHLAFLKGSIWGSLIPHPAMVALAADLTATHAPFATWLKYVYLSTLYHALQRYKYKVYIYIHLFIWGSQHSGEAQRTGSYARPTWGCGGWMAYCWFRAHSKDQGFKGLMRC